MEFKLWNRNFTLLTLSNFFMCSAYYSLISTLPVYISVELHSPKSVVGLVLASYIVAAVLVRPLAGFGLDKYGRKTIFIASLLFYALIFNGYLVAWTVAVMIVVRFTHGLTWGLITTSNSTVAVDIIPPEKRGQGIGYFGVSTTLGMALGPVIGSFILLHGGYSAMFLAGFAISLASMAMAASIRYPYHTPLKNLEFKTSNLFETKTLLPSLNLLLIMITYGGVVSFIALYGREIGIGNPSGFFLIYATGVIGARFSSGKFFDRHGPKMILMVCLSLLIIGFPFLAFIKNSFGFYGAAVILGFGNGVVFPTFQAMTNNMVLQNRRGAANSTLFAAVDIGMGLGMVITGTIAQRFSISSAFLVCAAICIVALAFFLVYTSGYYQRNKVTGELVN
ncbi:MAG: MFS transporter [Bacteroidetes bacterium]|nr:MFS transporter [Bacteroidota bacterium]